MTYPQGYGCKYCIIYIYNLIYNYYQSTDRMPKLGKTQFEKVEKLKARAQALRDEGYTLDDVGKKVGRTGTWVWIHTRPTK